MTHVFLLDHVLRCAFKDDWNHMNELPASETDVASEIDHGELFRKSLRHFEPGAMRARDRKVLWSVLVVTAATAALLALVR